MLLQNKYSAYNAPYTRTTRPSGVLRSRSFGMGCSCLIGAVAGVLFILLVSTLGVKAIQTIAQIPSGQQSVTVTVQEDYLNSEANKRINGHFATGVDGISVTGLQIDLNPSNRLDLNAQFNVSAGFFNFNTSAGISNQISAQDGKIVINMVGQPKIADLTIPIDALPFNLPQEITSAINRVNNDIIAAQLNDVLNANLEGTDLALDSITTDDTSLTLHLKVK